MRLIWIELQSTCESDPPGMYEQKEVTEEQYLRILSILAESEEQQGTLTLREWHIQNARQKVENLTDWEREIYDKNYSTKRFMPSKEEQG